MRTIAKRMTLSFAAGCLGGLVNSLAVWLCGIYRITRAFDVRMAPDLTVEWLYPRIVWGGLWGLLFALPLLRDQAIKRGLLLSLGPTIVQLLVIFPYKTPHGVLGLGLGNYTPLFVLAFNGIWGIATALWLKYIS